MNRFVAFWGTLLLLTAAAGAAPLTLDGAVEQALRVNSDYQNSLLAVERARNALTWGANWKNVAVSATRKETSGSGTAGTPGAQAATSATSFGLSLPLFDQLGASVSLDQEQNAQVSVTANPLSHSDTAVQARLSYEKAVLSATSARVALESSVKKAYLAQSAAEAQLQVQTRKNALAETTYQDAKARYEKGKVTLAEVRTALQSWIQARGSQTSAERNLIKARADLAARLQSDTVEVLGVDRTGVEAALEALGPLDATVKGSSSSVKLQALEVESQRAKADAVWLMDPGLSVQGSASIPAAGDLTWSGSVTVSLALGDWQGTEKALAERSAALAVQALESQRVAARSTEAQAVLAVTSALDTVETRKLALAQAQELQGETQLLAKTGAATSLEVEDADLGVLSAQIDLFTAWADLYGARLDLTTARS